MRIRLCHGKLTYQLLYLFMVRLKRTAFWQSFLLFIYERRDEDMLKKRRTILNKATVFLVAVIMAFVGLTPAAAFADDAARSYLESNYITAVSYTHLTLPTICSV